jgi:probable rRNA maturation factor
METALTLNLLIDNRQDKIEVTEELENVIKNAIKTALTNEGLKVKTEISMILIDDNEIKQINKEFRGIDKATDVLSFPAFDDQEDFNLLINDCSAVDMNSEALVLGDIAISLETANRQSIEYGHSFYREAAYLTVHSILHLLGYDHMEEDEKKVMRDREEIIMNKVGLTRGE